MASSVFAPQKLPKFAKSEIRLFLDQKEKTLLLSSLMQSLPSEAKKSLIDRACKEFIEIAIKVQELIH